MRPTYRIADEPSGGRFASLAVNPFWPLLAAMLAGSWLALPWYVVNGLAMGSATRRRELAWVVGGIAVSAALGMALFRLLDGGHLSVRAFRYLLVGAVAWRLVVAYALFSLQQPSFELHRYFGGKARNGVLLVVAGALVRPQLLDQLGVFLLFVLG